MLIKRRRKKEYPRSINQLGRMKIRAGAELSFRPEQILSFLPEKTGGRNVL
ncbi:hypothetical protein [Methanospirillum sp.]|uniref:hypothetical protein n=1 Tax=Methanospirillum sp. TaxID=45200 RepID=UPI0035A0F0D3